jgi:hypothetical protein
LIIAGFLDIVSSNYRRVSVVVIPSVGREIDFPQELLLMMLEFSNHFASMFCLDVVVEFGGEV